MRIIAAYGLVFYGVMTVLAVKGAIERGRMAAGGGLAQALNGVTMIFAAFGVLMGLWLGLVVAVGSVVVASLLAGYHAVLLDGRQALRRQGARTTVAVLLIAALLLG